MRHPAAWPLPKESSLKAPAAGDFRSPTPRAPVVDFRSRMQPASGARQPARSKTRPPWRSPRVMRAPVPVVPVPVAAVAQVVPERAAVAQVVPEPAAVARPVAAVPVELVAVARPAELVPAVLVVPVVVRLAVALEPAVVQEAPVAARPELPVVVRLVAVELVPVVPERAVLVVPVA
ncbi:MAG: hypothetical protein HY997_05020 [Mycolicibacterium neoaurum]|nr:hypothetical protein [Mycolicibacterium neoaurum]